MKKGRSRPAVMSCVCVCAYVCAYLYSRVRLDVCFASWSSVLFVCCISYMRFTVSVSIHITINMHLFNYSCILVIIEEIWVRCPWRLSCLVMFLSITMARSTRRTGYPAVHRTPNDADGTQSSVRPVRSYTRLRFGSTVCCSNRDVPNGPFDLLRGL